MRTVLLLFASNLFMTFAWYGHLKVKQWPLWLAIAASWLIALPEYCLQVPANRYGHGQFTAAQLKIIQEGITLVVFAVFSTYYLGERMQWNHWLAFALVFSGVFVGNYWSAPKSIEVSVRLGAAAKPEAP